MGEANDLYKAALSLYDLELALSVLQRTHQVISNTKSRTPENICPLSKSWVHLVNTKENLKLMIISETMLKLLRTCVKLVLSNTNSRK